MQTRAAKHMKASVNLAGSPQRLIVHYACLAGCQEEPAGAGDCEGNAAARGRHPHGLPLKMTTKMILSASVPACYSSAIFFEINAEAITLRPDEPQLSWSPMMASHEFLVLCVFL